MKTMMNLVTLTNLRIVKIVEVIAVMEKAKEDNAILRPREPQVMLMVQNKAVQSYPNDLEIEVLTEFHSIDQKVMCESSEPSVSFFNVVSLNLQSSRPFNCNGYTTSPPRDMATFIL